jgi:Ca2+-binding EF-hand superfamily protein
MRALGFQIKKTDVIKYFKEIPKDITESLTFKEFI